MLVRLETRGFRNLAPVSLELGAGRHLIVGHNGAGKTSLIESVYVLATTRSFRTPRIVDAVCHGASGLRLCGEFVAGDLVDDVATRLEILVEGRDRHRRVNGERVTLANHLAVQPIMAWTSTDLDVLVGSPEARRRFLDRGIVGRQPAAIEAISRYRAALEAKRSWLKSGLAGDREQLRVWNQLLADAASELIGRRDQYARRLADQLEAVLREADLGIPPIEVQYRPSPAAALEGGAAAFEAFEKVADKEIVLEQPLLGPQRDDWALRWDGHGVRRVASAGERKALSLVLSVAHGRVLRDEKVHPVVLLDDVDVELDPARLRRLWTLLDDYAQVFVTSARPEVWQGLDIDHKLTVEEGRIIPA